MRDGFALPITDMSRVGEARREAGRLASALGFDETEGGKVAIVVSEVATNLVKHANGGDLVVRPLRADGARGLEVLALDKGPGIANVAESLRDGYSTAGTPGNGLGAVRRLSTRFDIYSQPGNGTAVLAEMWRGAKPPITPGRELEVGGVCVPVRGEAVCGDGWAAEARGDRTTLVMIDGLGHGEQAAEARREAVQMFREVGAKGPQTVMEAIHGALKSTRGAAVAVAEIDPPAALLRYSGVGNIDGVVLSASGQRHLVSHNGVLGHEVRRIDEFTYPWPADGLLVLHSDGLGRRWSLDRYPGLDWRCPALVAGVLYRDFTRGRDDVTVVVARAPRS